MADTEVKLSESEEKMLKPFAKEIKDISASRPEGEWMVNIAHFMGYQYSEWDSSKAATNGRLVIQPRLQTRSVRIIENRMMPSINKMVAVIMSNIRTPLVRPPHAITIQERNRIETSNALLRELSMPWELDDASNWELFIRTLCLTGTAFNWEYWNPRDGTKFKTAVGELLHTGKHAREVLQPFDVFPELHVLSTYKMNHIQIRRLSTVDEIKRLYGKTVPADKNISSISAGEWQIRNLGHEHRAPHPAENLKYVYVTLVRPNAKFPKGKEIHWTIQGDSPEAVLYDDDNKNPNGELQVAMTAFSPVGTGWSTSPASQARQNNVSYNAMLSAQIQSERNALHQVLLVSNDSRISESELTERTRNKLSIVHYDPDGTPPVPLDIKSASGQSFRILDQLDKGLQDMMFQHGTMSGQVQGQIRSQPAVQEVRETDLLPLQPLIERIRQMVSDVGGWRLAMARKWFTEPRTASVMSDANQWKAFDFQKSNLSKSVQLYIPQEPNLPLSLDGKLNAIAKLQSINPNNPELLSTMFSEIFHVDRMSGVASLERDHRESQREEIEVLLTGSTIPVNAYDNHPLHMDELDRYRNRNRTEFKALDPMVQAMFQDHHDAHKSALMDQMVEDSRLAQLQALASGEIPPEETGGGQGQQQAEVTETA